MRRFGCSGFGSSKAGSIRRTLRLVGGRVGYQLKMRPLKCKSRTLDIAVLLVCRVGSFVQLAVRCRRHVQHSTIVTDCSDPIFLERYIFVIHRRDVVARAASARGCTTASTAAEVTAVIGRRSAAARAQELDTHRDNVGGLALAAAVLRLVLAVGDSPLDVNRAALLQVLRAGLALFAPHGDVVPVGAFLPRTALVGERVLGRD